MPCLVRGPSTGGWLNFCLEARGVRKRRRLEGPDGRPRRKAFFLLSLSLFFYFFPFSFFFPIFLFDFFFFSFFLFDFSFLIFEFFFHF